MNNKIRILIVEDSEDDSLFLIREIRRNGYEPVFERVDTLEAMSTALDEQAWDIVLSDYSMPGFGGGAALGILKARGIDLPLIIVSGKIGEEKAVDLMKEGASDCIMKGNLLRLVPAMERAILDSDTRKKQKQAEESLRESEDKFRTYFEKAPFGYQSLDENGCFIDVNDAWLEILQYSREEVIGRSFADFIAPEYVEKFRENFPCFKKEGEIQGVEFKIVRRDGEHVLMSISGKVGYDERGNFKQTHCILQDITERKNLEVQLMRFHKMEALGQLARGVAHDFNNILAALSGYGNLLKMKIKKDKSSTHNIDQILSLTERATGLTQNLLAFNRDRMINPKPENLNELIKRSKKILSRILNKHIKLKTVFTDKNLTVMIDSGQMENILINLATNARDAMPEEGLLTIKTEPVEIGRGDVTHFSHEKSGRYALMTVTDTGIGMDEKTREKIFELFYTTKSSDKGMGLGTSIVREIIRRNNGHITVESSPGKGTTFKIYLPLVGRVVEEIRKKTPHARIAGTGVILLAEDDMEFRGKIKSVLEEFSYEVIEAVDGQDAIDKFRKNKERIQLILLESVMSKKNALEVYTEAKNIRPDVKALLMSGYGEDILRKKGISVEGLSFLQKPVSPQELLSKVREVLVN